MPKKKLKIALCQFPVSGSLNDNFRYIQGYIKKAASCGAEVIAFPEAALTGYAASCPEYQYHRDVSFKGYDWNALREKTSEVMSLANECKIWVILGSAHYLSDRLKPTNCLYVISSSGNIIDRYDKCECVPEDLKVYTPGNRLVTIRLKGIKCGFLICADCENTHLYHAYWEKGVRVLFHSYYNARFKGPLPNDKYIPPLNRRRAQEYGMWVFASNSSARHSCWPASISGPDGSFRSLKRHVSGLLYHDVDSIKPAKRKTIWHTGKSTTVNRYVNGKSLP